ncbi:hypothetical protein HAHE_04600 [Haloferula helveola]|uniref:Uncharacterized protein n=1 Tax=Haloferula helveola TaxID=490095 RepID=A0ABN6H0C4_9BACT|nr:hypothetical protein HAHE_04600 [Haloferula helveola]
MKDELPEHLRPVRDALMQTAHGSEPEDFPEASEELLDDLEEKLRGRIPQRAAKPAVPWYQQVMSFLATPAFGAVAALVVILFFAAPLFTGPDRFRDPGDGSGSTARIVLVGADQGTFDSLSSDGLIDPASVVRTEEASEAESVEPPKLIVDFKAGTLRQVRADGTVVDSDLPEDPALLPGAIAKSLRSLDTAESP